MRQVKPIIHFTSIFVLLFFVVSCVRDTLIDPGETAVVVVDCVLLDSSPQTLHLSFGKAPSASAAPELKDAVARLIDLTEGEEAGVFLKGEGNAWTLDYSAVHEHSYRLEVEVPGYEMIWAEQTMPRQVKVKCHNVLLDDFHHLGTAGCFYMMSELSDYTWIYAMNYDKGTGRHQIAEEICTDYYNVDIFNITGKEYIPDQIDSVDCFGQPCKAELYPSMAGKPIHRRFLRLFKYEFDSNDLSKRPTFFISGSFAGDYYSLGFFETVYPDYPEPDEGWINFVAVSDEYDLYLRDAIHFQQLDEISDMTSVFIRDNVYSNIHGGIGFFGACAEQKVPWMRNYTLIFPE